MNLSRLPKHVTIVEVGPRDGLQNESAIIPLNVKLALIEDLARAGLKHIEVGSFVSPKWVPQMADSAALFEQLTRQQDVLYSALTPNMQGLDNALNVKADQVAIFGAASETFSQKNINCSIEQSLARFEPVVNKATSLGVPVRGYVSCVLGCPDEGEIAPKNVARVAQRLIDMGCYEVSLGDTIGKGTPLKTQHMLEAVLTQIDVDQVAVHFHNTYGQALANILMALSMGIHTIDTSVAGLGGCPYAKGASGNVATEDVLYMLNEMKIETGVNLDNVISAGKMIMGFLAKPNQSNVANAYLSSE